MRNPILLLLPLVTFLSVAACDDETGPGERDRAEAFVRDQPSSATFTGTLTTNANVSVSTNGSTWIDLGSPNGITIQLQNAGTGTTVHGEVDIPAGAYTRVRLAFRNAQALIRAGSTVGGVTLASDVIVAVGGSDREIVIEKQISAATGGETIRFTFDLNAASWINAANVQDRVVEDAELTQAVQLSVS